LADLPGNRKASYLEGKYENRQGPLNWAPEITDVVNSSNQQKKDEYI
jgi:hypothetical protein